MQQVPTRIKPMPSLSAQPKGKKRRTGTAGCPKKKRDARGAKAKKKGKIG